MELKCESLTTIIRVLNGFNRTFMELKFLTGKLTKVINQF